MIPNTGTATPTEIANAAVVDSDPVGAPARNSFGLDQGQLTSRTPEPTPFIEDLLSYWRSKEQKAAR